MESMHWCDLELYLKERMHSLTPIPLAEVEPVRTGRIPELSPHVTGSQREKSMLSLMKKYKGIYVPQNHLVEQFQNIYNCPKSIAHPGAKHLGRNLIGFTSPRESYQVYSLCNSETERCKDLEVCFPKSRFAEYELVLLPIYKCDCGHRFVPRDEAGRHIGKLVKTFDKPVSLSFLLRNHQDEGILPKSAFK
jgi:hypothetical protein